MPFDFEPIVGLVVIGLINLILGGVIGVAIVGLDFYVRDQVLSNRRLFDRGPTTEGSKLPERFGRLVAHQSGWFVTPDEGAHAGPLLMTKCGSCSQRVISTATRWWRRRQINVGCA